MKRLIHGKAADALSDEADSPLRDRMDSYCRIIIPEIDGTFRGEILECPGCIVTGQSAGKTYEKLDSALESWVAAVIDKGQSVPNPLGATNEFSGKFLLRLSKRLHKHAAYLAAKDGISLNQFVAFCVAEIIGKRAAINQLAKGDWE